jgi:hypothetical protein
MYKTSTRSIDSWQSSFWSSPFHTYVMPVDRSKIPCSEGEVHDAELMNCYGPEKFAPVHIGDEFHDGKYRILDKLGVGSYATVWLAKNTEYEIDPYEQFN